MFPTKQFFYCIILIIVFSNKLLSQDTIRLDNPKQLSFIGTSVYFMIDSTNQLTIEQIQEAKLQSLFKKGEQIVPNFSNISSTIWAKFTIENISHSTFLLEISNPLLTSINFYTSNSKYQMGSSMPFSNRTIKNNNYLFELTSEKDSVKIKTFYVQIKSFHPAVIPMKIGSPISFMEKYHKDDIGYSLYFGIMLVMALYNLFVFFTLRDKTYLYYVGYVLSVAILYATDKGYTSEFLWQDYETVNFYFPTIAAFVFIFITLFTVNFLHTKTYTPRLHIGFFFIGGLPSTAIIIFNVIGNYAFGMIIVQFTSLIFFLYLLLVGVVNVLAKNRLARYYLLAWIVYVTMMVIFFLFLAGVLPGNVITINALFFGSAVEVILLSFALADKINVLKKEKEATQVQLLSSLKENDRIIREQNRILEERVTERTFQLQEANEELNQTVEELNATNETLNRINVQVADQNKEIEAKNIELNEVLQELNAMNEELSSTNDALVNANEEIESQREAVARAYENIKILTIIGQKITQTLDLKEIIKMVYENVNELMDASGFGLGVYNAKLQELAFDGFMEKGKELPFHFHSTKEENYLAVWCFRRKQSIFINDVAAELKNYIDKDIDSMKISTGEIPQSLLYIPLLHEEEVIGVITVQSFEKNAYTQTHFDLLQNLASYCSIAVANANTYQELDAKNANITKSIEYARTIQYAVLPKQTDIANSFADHFILYKPKDIVSGDFYWYRSTEQFTFFAVSDCTGHGVPGAFMSMIGNAILQDAIDRQQIYNPAAILEFIHVEVRNYLKKDDNTTSDGMDIAICMFEGLGTSTIKTTFAAAKRSIYVAHNQTVEEIKGDRTMIGTPEVVGRKPFTNKELILTKGTKLYLFSDGYVDQPNAKRSRFGTVAFKQIIDDSYQLSMAEQKQIFVDKLNAFQEIEEQRDDITVVGLEL